MKISQLIDTINSYSQDLESILSIWRAVFNHIDRYYRQSVDRHNRHSPLLLSRLPVDCINQCRRAPSIVSIDPIDSQSIDTIALKTFCRSYQSIQSKGTVQSWMKSLSCRSSYYLRIPSIRLMGLFTALIDSVDQLFVICIDQRGLFRARVDSADQLSVDRIDCIDWYDRRRLFRVDWKLDCVDQLTISLLYRSSEQEWILSINYLSNGWLYRSIDRYDRVWLFRIDWRVYCVNRLTCSQQEFCRSYGSINTIKGGSSELIVLISWLSIVTIDTIKWVPFRTRVDCVDQLRVNQIEWRGLFKATVGCLSLVSIEGGPSDQELVVSIDWQPIISIEGHYSEQEFVSINWPLTISIKGRYSEQESTVSINWPIRSTKGAFQSKSWLGRSTGCQSFRSLQ